jgi:hypothetical protein
LLLALLCFFFKSLSESVINFEARISFCADTADCDAR